MFFDAESVFFTPIFRDIIQQLVIWQGINLCELQHNMGAKLHNIKPIRALFCLKTYWLTPASMKKRSPRSPVQRSHNMKRIVFLRLLF
jgi:hypothetical protein